MTSQIDSIILGRQLLQEQFPTISSQKSVKLIFKEELQTLLIFMGELNRDVIGYDFNQHRITKINPVPLTDTNVILYIRDQLLYRVGVVAKRIFPDTPDNATILFEYLTYKLTGKMVTDYQNFICNGPDPRTLIPRFSSPLEDLNIEVTRPRASVEVKQSRSPSPPPVDSEDDNDELITAPSPQKPWYRSAMDAVKWLFRSIYVHFMNWIRQLKS